MANSDEQLGQLAKRYADNQELLTKVYAKIKEISQTLSGLATELNHGLRMIRLPDANTLKITYRGSTIPVNLLTTLHETLTSLREAEEDQKTLESSLKEAGLETLIKRGRLY